jgi:outer membrane protein OmpA-like peptidoglycan-associated protein
MKLFNFLFLVVCTFSFCKAQQQLLFSEDFNDNKNVWLENDNPTRSAFIRNGKYELSYKQFTNSWNFWNQVSYFSNSKDFKIETKMVQTEGDLTRPYSLIWGVKDAYNGHGISLNGQGQFRVYSWVDSQFIDVKTWTYNQAINKQGIENIVRIEAKSNKINYYINEVLVFSNSKPNLFGAKIGINLERRMKVNVDYIRVWQDQKINLVSDAKQGRKKENPGKAINSESNDIMPVLSADGLTLYFVRKKYEGNIGKDKKDDVWVSNLGPNGWSTAQNIGAPINNDDYNFVIFAAPDGQTLIVGNRYRSDGAIQGKGISMSRKSGNNWTIPQNIEIENYVNSDNQVAISFSANRKVMMLSVAGKGCYGYKDIYVSFQIDETHYTEPKNLGPVVNSYLDETTPYLAADGKTLYFSSEGHMGYGSADVFVTRRLDDSWTRWTEPQNLGPEINAEGWDAYYSIPATGNKAYMVSSDAKLGNTDIISIEVPKSAQPDPVAILSGRILHGISKKPLSSEISFYSGKSHKEAGLSNSDSIKGEFKMILPLGTSYEVLPLKRGFYAGTELIELKDKSALAERKFDMLLYPLQKGITIPIGRLRFDDKVQPTEAALNEIDRLADLLEQYPDMKIELHGSKDDTKAKDQAIKVAELLKKSGINYERLSISQNNALAAFSFTIMADKPQVIAEKSAPKNFNKTIDVNKISSGECFRINELYYMSDSTSFTPNSIRALDELADFLRKNSNTQVEIGGHTSGLPAHAYCDKLSLQRAENVVKYLISKGVNANQLSAKGYGKRAPVSDNTTEYGRRMNQRVEVKILKAN